MKAIEAKRAQQAQVDSQMLEMLSSSYLYPDVQHKKKPKGRPDMVAGAMRKDTMVKYREKVDAYKEGKITFEQYMDTSDESADTGTQVNDQQFTMTPPKRGRGRPKKIDTLQTLTDNIEIVSNGVKGVSRSPSNASELPNVSENPKTATKRKRVVKNLPPSRTQKFDVKIATGMMSRSPNGSSESNDLQQYYRTELLTAKEEYSLGMKVQFMVKCEQVHEGAALRLGRLPTIQEWAASCG